MKQANGSRDSEDYGRWQDLESIVVNPDGTVSLRWTSGFVTLTFSRAEVLQLAAACQRAIEVGRRQAW